jgi:hypothetical protein
LIEKLVLKIRELFFEGHEEKEILENILASCELNELLCRMLVSHSIKNICPPENFDDIKVYFVNSILNKDIKDIKKFLTYNGPYSSIIEEKEYDYLELDYFINYLRNNFSLKLLNEIIDVVRDYFDIFILNINSNPNKNYSKIDSNTMEKYNELFGIWNKNTILAYLNKNSSSDIFYIEDDFGRKSTFCPKFNSEVSIENICKNCPFYEFENKCFFKK